jgi:hypothetical protein
MRTLRAAFLPLLLAVPLFASQPLETETARPLTKGMFKIELTAEYQHSREGTERAFPLVFEYGITDRTEITVEPVFGTSIRPKHGTGTSASGTGDVEVTLTHLFLPETTNLPAFAAAGEVKIPTARNRLIGTGKTDFTLWAIGSKRFDRLDLHANLGYTVLGKPAGVKISNIVNYAIAEEYHVTPKFDVVGELIGNTSSTGDKVEGATPNPNLPAEIIAAETSAMVGVRWHMSPALFVSVGVSFDNNHAIMVRPGVTWRFHK